MTVNIQTVRFDADSKLIRTHQQKASKSLVIITTGL